MGGSIRSPMKATGNNRMHDESRVARLFEVNAVRRDPVNIGVMRAKRLTLRVDD